MKKIDVNGLTFNMLYLMSSSPYFLQIAFSLQVENEIYDFLFHTNIEDQKNLSMHIGHMNDDCPFCNRGIYEDCRRLESVLSEIHQRLINDPKIRLQLLFR